MTADEIMKEIENMDNGERIKLLDMLFHKHFDNRLPRELIAKRKHGYLEDDDE